MSPISPFSYLNGAISYQPVYKDTIFHITKSGVIPKYRLDFGKYWLDEDFLLNDNLDAMKFMRDLNKLNAINFLNVIESSGHMFVYFTFKDKKFAFLYDKITQKGKFIRDYMENGCGYNGLPIISDGEFFVGIVTPYELSNVDLKLLKKQLNNGKIDIFNNPILSYVKFKRIN